MSAQQNAGFGQFIPGFDFLQNLAKGSSSGMPRMPNLSSWVAPTLNLEELEKRIGELKAVQFWLEQNRTALGATIQALELQKMTLATLKGMNMNMADIADAMTLRPGAATGSAADANAGSAKAGKTAQSKGDGGKGDETKVVDPLQWWGALTQQFQQIAATAMQEVAASADSTTTPKAGSGEERGGAAPGSTGAAAKRATKPKRPSGKRTEG